MAEPTSASSMATWLAVLLTASVPNVDADILIGAICGGVVFLLHNRQYAVPTRLIMMMLSITLGYRLTPYFMETSGITSSTLVSLFASGTIIVALIAIITGIEKIDFNAIIHRLIDTWSNVWKK